MKGASKVMGNDSIKAQAEVEHCGIIITKILLALLNYTHMIQMDTDVANCLAGFISKSILYCLWWYPWRKFCFGNQYLRYIPTKLSVDGINRWGLVKPNDLVYAICAPLWDTYLHITENYEAKSVPTIILSMWAF